MGKFDMSYSEYYAQKLEDGLKYQDFVLRALHRRGIILQPLCSVESQKRAENLLGMEIKCDMRLEETGNVYIETHEKSKPDRPFFVLSGILKEDNSWLYAIGNYVIFYIFSKKQLIAVYRKILAGSKWNGVTTKELLTSKGFIIPATLAEEWSAKTVYFNEGDL